MKLVNFAALLFATACTVPAASSRAVLPEDASHLVVAEPALDAARDVTRLFAARSFAMVDQRPLPDGSIALVYKGARGAVTEGDKHGVDTWAVGSVFHVHIAPVAADRADVQIVGVPMLDGAEKCRPDGSDCDQVPRTVDERQDLQGHAEAEVVHGVFSELTLEGRTAGR